ncbi:MAG: valine--pyruvate transaminase [Chloroflexaceae bacterium]
MKFSQFSQKFSGDCGILRLMDDLGQAAQRADVIMLGGGNPAHIPQMQAAVRERMEHILASEYAFETLISNYGPPGGDQAFVSALVDLFRRDYGWDIGPENIVLTNGSQTAFFFLFNMFAGAFPDGSYKRILLPLAPEYIGYEDAGISDNLFVANQPHIDYLDQNLFKYRVDFDALTITEDIGAICVSRPTNPTGNVLTEDEIATLSRLARQHNIPLIVDNAYGMPFPGIIFTEAVAAWEPHIIMCMSLSKLGIPGARTGIVVADAQVIRAITGMNAVISLAPGSFGAALAHDLVRTREIVRLSQEVIRPYYQHKSQQAITWLREELAGTNFYVHKSEGAIFLWLWFPGLPVTCQELYERLKARGVVVVPGHYFFPGLQSEWQHKHECFRLNYAGDAARVHAGIKIIGEEVRKLRG